MKTGSERAVDENDLLPLKEATTSWFLTKKLQAKWTEEKADSQIYGVKPKLWKSILKMLTAKEKMIIISAMSVETLCHILQPLLLGHLVKSLMTEELHNMYLLYSSAIALGINGVISSVAMHHANYQCEQLGIKISSAKSHNRTERDTQGVGRDILIPKKLFLELCGPCENSFR